MTIVIDGTTGISGVDGTASNPSYEGTDSNTGIFYPAADTVAIGTGGTERVRVSSAGVVGVNTTSPAAIGANYGTIDIRGSSGGGFNLGTTGTLTGQIYGNSSGITYDAQGATSHFWYANGAERARITSDGRFLIGKTTTSTANQGIVFNSNANCVFTVTDTGASDTLNVWNDTAGAYRFYVTRGGTIFATSTTISAISDIRLKENIQDLDVGLDAVMALKPRKFDWKEGKGKNIKGDRGWIAQEFEQVFPDMISTWKDEPPEGEEPYKSVGADLIPVLVKAMQQQQAMIDEMKAEIAALKAQP
jgi:hypothetical protein